MKRILLSAAILLTACGANQAEYVKAENALDAGREFINACLQGDFSRAAFFMVPGGENEQKLGETEKVYRQKDKEGRQQLRTASINIHEVKALNDSVTLLIYSYSFDKLPQTLRIVKQKDSWLADFTNKNTLP